MARRNLFINLALLATATALSLSPKARAPTRSEFFKGAAAFSAAAAVGAAAPASAATTLPSGLKYEVIKSNPNGAIPKIGDLIAIRFKGSTEGRVFDDITKTDEPLYYRVGGGSLIKGIDEAVTLMHYGETWGLTIPGDLGFGPKGRSASAGKPRIPPNAELYYEVQFVGFPGFEGDLFLQLNQ